MNFKILLALILLTPNTFAKEPASLRDYLILKAIRCDLSEDQLNQQVTQHLDRTVKQLQDALKARGISVQQTMQSRDDLQIGFFPNSGVFDFSVKERISILTIEAALELQTVHYNDVTQPATIEAGLWMPLTVTDTGFNMPCKLDRISMKVTDRDLKFVPSVNLVLAESQRIVVPNIIEVMDLQRDTPAPVVIPQAPPPPPAAPQPQEEEKKSAVKEKTQEEPDATVETKSRRRSRSERRHYRHHRRHSRSRRSSEK